MRSAIFDKEPPKLISESRSSSRAKTRGTGGGGGGGNGVTATSSPSLLNSSKLPKRAKSSSPYVESGQVSASSNKSINSDKNTNNASSNKNTNGTSNKNTNGTSNTTTNSASSNKNTNSASSNKNSALLNKNTNGTSPLNNSTNNASVNSNSQSHPKSKSHRSKQPSGLNQSTSSANTTNSSNGASTNNSTNNSTNTTNANHSSNWNFDEMINSYKESGSLPSILSPTLPAQFVGSDSEPHASRKVPRISLYEDDEGEDPIDNDIIMVDDTNEDTDNYQNSKPALTATLDKTSPSAFQNLEKSRLAKDDSPALHSKPSTPPRADQKHNYKSGAAKGPHDGHDDDDDDLPLSMLSPTLPSIFSNTSTSKPLSPTGLAQPIPQKPSDKTLLDEKSLKSVALSTSETKADTSKPVKKSTSVKWINKLSDTKRPRFLLRISYNPNNKHKLKVSSSNASSEKLAGLGISMGKANNEKQDAEKAAKERLVREREEIEKEQEETKMERKREKELERDVIKRREKDQIRERERETIKLEKGFKATREKERDQERDKQRKAKEREVIRITGEQRKLESEKDALKNREKSRPGPNPPPGAPPIRLAKDAISMEQQRKADQLRKLNEDLMRTEQEKSKDLERTRIEQNQSPPPSKYGHDNPTLSQNEREDYKTALLDKKNFWIKLARQVQREISQVNFTKEPFISIVMQFDSLLLSMISFDYDERSKSIANILPSERYWNSMYQDIAKFLDQISGFYKTMDISNKAKKCVGFLIGVLFQTKAIVLKRINAILQKVIESYTTKRSTDSNKKSIEIIQELNNKIIELQQQTISNSNSMINNFAKAQTYLNSSPSISIIFPQTWYNRAPRINPHQNNTSSLVPGSDNFYLPIGIYSDLREVGGFIFSCVCEFIDQFIVDEEDTPRPKYKLKAGLKGAPDDKKR